MLEKNTQISNFTKIRPVGVEFLQADRETYLTKQTVAFCSFANAPKKFLNVRSTRIQPRHCLHMTATQFCNCYTTQVIHLRVQFHSRDGE